MIILSGVLVVVAIALLVAGIVAGNGDSAEVFGLDALFVIYISIAVSIVSALCLAIGVFLRRKELFGPGVAATPARTSKSAKPKKERRKKSAPAAPAPAANATGAPAPAAAAADPADDEVEIPAPPADVPDDALVFVVRGRKRYHLDTCRQLAGRETEELTYAEAKEEGFSPCTACMPDTALAARAAASAPASPDAGKAKDAPEPPKPGLERSEGGLAGLAKPAPSPSPSFDKPGTFDKPASFDTTAEIPHSDRTADAPARREPERPAPGPAGPTLTDLPVTSLFEPAGKTEPAEKPAEKPAETDEAAEPESREEQPAPADTAAGSEPDALPETHPVPDADPAPEAVAPRPRDADEDDPEPHETPETYETPEPEQAAEAAPAGSDDNEGPQVRILSGTKRYHRTDCALIEDIGDEADDLEALSRGEAKSRGCTPCLVCQPDREHAS